ncbi:2Fe-2S iron-sulfur cluster-binding protein [Sinorhizobium fredii]|uniref:2Fe-2S iron-sulfur cluster-binding protein n=1 Tax=Rhizobium fredii TaxID=380 RepID=UPI00351210F3
MINSILYAPPHIRRGEVPMSSVSGGLGHTSRDAFHPCICVDRSNETHDVFTLVFEKLDSSGFHFVAGQFVTIRFNFEGQRFSRAFTIASPPTRPERVALTIKVAENGNATRVLHDHFKIGGAVAISEAAGDFTARGRECEKLLFVSAGSGVTPMMSMLRDFRDRGEQADVAFVQCARTETDILFDRELEELSQVLPLKVRAVCSRLSGGRGNFHAGRLDKAVLTQLFPDVHSRTAFICGPAGFMAQMRDALVELGVPRERIFQESFGPVPVPSNARVNSGATIVFERSKRQGEARGGETILDLAESASIYVDTACRAGVCGTCKTRLISGEVDMVDLGGLSEAERAEGYILACCSRPIGPVTLDL